MTHTPEFLEDRAKYQDKQHFLTFEEKQAIWNLCVMDYGNGYPQPYIPYPEMEAVHRSLARTKICSLPNRAGKSLAVAAEIVTRIAYPKGGIRIWLLAQEYAIADNEWLYFEDMIMHTDFLEEHLLVEIQKQMDERGLKGSPRKYVKVRHTPTKSLVINWPGKECSRTIVEQKSYKNSSIWSRLEGAKLDMAVFCEGATVPKDLWDRHIKKRLSDKAGEVWIPSTPKGEDDIMHPWFNKGLEKKMVVDIDYKRRMVDYHYEDVKKHPHHISITKSYIESFESFQWAGKESPYYNQDHYLAEEEALFNGELQESFFRESNYGEFTSKTGKFFDNTPEVMFVSGRRRHRDATTYEAVDIGAAAPSVCEWIDIEPPDEDGVETWFMHRELYRPNLWVGTPNQPDFDTTLCGLMLALRDGDEVQYTAVDRISARQSSANSPKTVERMMVDCGINVRLPSMDREQLLWMYKLKNFALSGRLIVDKDACPKFYMEWRQAEYEDRKYKNGKAIQKDRLAEGPNHALTALCYLMYTNPFWIKPDWQKKKELDSTKPAKGSLMYALMSEENSGKNALYDKIGMY